MIDYLKGELTELVPTTAVVECGGVGYDVQIHLLDYGELSGKREAKLYVHESIREDAHVLFGFLTKRAREIFRLLIGVSGVGPNTARLILSAYPIGQLENIIGSGDEKLLKTIKGIGGKMAQRIIVELKDKINSTGEALFTGTSVQSSVYEDSLAALVTLGFTKLAADKALRKVLADSPNIDTEQAIRKALPMIR